ncbi:MAG: hypothetical protein HOO91_12680 [Bacteroidales bacterium]|nr:hypothetical protein [Bacteroidales bacterium]
MKKNSTKHGFRLAADNRIKQDVLNYEEEIDNSIVCSFGVPITESVAKKMIQNYWDDLEEGRDNEKEVAFTFGRKALLSILSQSECEGIRFYYAKKKSDDYIPPSDIGNIDAGVSLVAIGVNKKFDIATTEKEYIVKRLRPNKPVTFMTESESETGQIFEMVPPIKLGFFLNRDKIRISEYYEELAQIIQEFFNKKK